MTVLSGKELKAQRNKHDLHVLLVMEAEGVNKVTALAQAYHEGAEGLAKRQAPKVEPELDLTKRIPPTKP